MASTSRLYLLRLVMASHPCSSNTFNSNNMYPSHLSQPQARFHSRLWVMGSAGAIRSPFRARFRRFNRKGYTYRHMPTTRLNLSLNLSLKVTCHHSSSPHALAGTSTRTARRRGRVSRQIPWSTSSRSMVVSIPTRTRARARARARTTRTTLAPTLGPTRSSPHAARRLRRGIISYSSIRTPSQSSRTHTPILAGHLAPTPPAPPAGLEFRPSAESRRHWTMPRLSRHPLPPPAQPQRPRRLCPGPTLSLGRTFPPSRSRSRCRQVTAQRRITR
jgi:hypothetical protein